MTHEEATELVTALVARYCGLERWVVTPHKNLRDELGLDSIDAAQMLVAVQETTGYELELDGGIEDIATVDAVAHRLVAAAARHEGAKEGVG